LFASGGLQLPFLLVAIMSKGGVRLAIVGSTSLKGKALREELAGSSMEIADVKLLDQDEFVGILTDYDGGAAIVSKLTEEALAECDLAFICGSPDHARECHRLLLESSTPAVDLSGCLTEKSCLATASLPAPAKRKLRSPVVIPESLSICLSTILETCLEISRIEFATATALLPVSDLGKDANTALHAQAVELLNFGGIPDDMFRRQLIFNLHPSFGQSGKRGHSLFEDKVLSEVGRLVSQTDMPLVIGAAMTPVFYGSAVSLTIKFAGEVSEDTLREILDDHVLIELFDIATDTNSLPTPLDSSQNRSFQVGRVMAIDGMPDTFLLWVGFDNILRGGVLDAIEVAKELLLLD